jgi:hypothetical protein
LPYLYLQEQPDTEIEHIVNVGSEERTELTNCTFLAWVRMDDMEGVRMDDMEVSCLSTLCIGGGAKCSTFGFVDPIGKSR